MIKELDLKRTQLLWESNKLSEAEAKIHHTEQEMARLKKEFTKLKMRLQESTEKLNEGGFKELSRAVVFLFILVKDQRL